MPPNSSTSSVHDIEQGSELMLRLNSDGLITAVVQESSSGEILMLAHMNNDSFLQTLNTGKATFWSRSRQQLWIKGETSGNFLHVDEILIDCDQDAVVIRASLEGDGACHTGKKSCFYRKVENEGEIVKLSHV